MAKNSITHKGVLSDGEYEGIISLLLPKAITDQAKPFNGPPYALVPDVTPTPSTPPFPSIPSIPSTPPKTYTLDTVFTDLDSFVDCLIDLGISKDTRDKIKLVKNKTYTMSDAIAIARTAKLSTKDIINRVVIKDSKGNPLTTEALQAFNNNEVPDNCKALVTAINRDNPNAKAYAYKWIDYAGVPQYTIRYNNVDGENVGYSLKTAEGFRSDMTPAEARTWLYSNSVLGYDAITLPVQAATKQAQDEWDAQYGSTSNNGGTSDKGNIAEEEEAEARANAKIIANANAQIDTADKIEKVLQGNTGSNAKTDRTLTQEDIDAVTATLPGTNNLKAWNQANKYNVHQTVGNNMIAPNALPNVVNRASLSDLQQITNSIDAENQDKLLRDIEKQKQSLIEQIQRDPALYESIITQLRGDAAANIIAGQRAARAGNVVKTGADQYGADANSLYENLFSGENNVAAKARELSMGNSSTILNAYIQSALNNALKGGQAAVNQSNDIATALEAMGVALDVDNSKYENAAAENQAKADTNKTTLVDGVKKDVDADITEQDGFLQYIYDTYGIGADVLNSVSNGDIDISNAVNTIANAINKDGVTPVKFTQVTAPEYKASKQFENKEYAAVLNNPTYNAYLANIEGLTSNKSLKDIIKEPGLVDMLTEEAMSKSYEHNADTANKYSNQVFNAAQRAYIASIIAGDAKAASSLERLARSTNSAKGNLYAASMLSNQYNRQTNALNTGRNIVNNIQNQISDNKSAIDQSKLAANQALTNYIGTGKDDNSATLYKIADLFDTAASNNRASFGSYGNKMMSTTQGMNTTNTNVSLGNNNRLAQLAQEYTDANFAAGVNNTKNSGTRNTMLNEVKALRDMANATKNAITSTKK